MRAAYKNVTVALSLQAYADLQVLRCRYGCKSFSEIMLKLIELETKEPREISN